MTLRISDQVMTSDATRHTARQLRPDVWTVSWLPGRLLDRNQATTAMVLAEKVAETVANDELHCGHRLWPLIDQWAAELGLTGPDAVVRASEPPRSTP
jgi:hypothetical protein